MTYSITVPVYKNEQSIARLLVALEDISARVSGKLEVIFVIDGSPDQSFTQLTALLPAASFRSKVLVLSRNFGSFAAIRVGLQKASGQYFAVMAADLQEPPELVLGFFEILERDEADVVVGTRSGREDPLVSRIASHIYWLIHRKFIQPDTPPGGVDIFGFNESFRKELLSLNESHSSLVGLVLWLGFRRKTLSYKRQKRREGKSGWTFRKRIRYVSDSAFSFSNTPIQALFWMGFFGLTLSAVFAIAVIWARLSGRVPVPGYSAVILTIIFFGSLNLVCHGIVGSYLWRTFENTKLRPGAVVMREFSFGAGTER